MMTHVNDGIIFNPTLFIGFFDDFVGKMKKLIIFSVYNFIE